MLSFLIIINKIYISGRVGRVGRLKTQSSTKKKGCVVETTTSIKKTILFKTALNPPNLPNLPNYIFYQTIYIDTIHKFMKKK